MFDEPVVLPISDTLDLHTFDPKDLPELIPDYLEACREEGLLRVRIIHGKGKGILRERVHAILRRLGDIVEDFQLADRHSGDWGATVVLLRPAAPAS
jgi:DNA-nicking Smr family endonuclease